jgi:hypothetical protein
MTRIARAGALLALASLIALALAGPATAKKKPHKDGKGAKSAQTLPKKWAKKHKAKAAKADPDRDGLTNWGEFRSHTKPKRPDSDRDGVGDAAEDYDRDGLANGAELDARTDPGRKDSDRDGIKDGAEDADGDGLANAAEVKFGHDLRDPDTDGDGIKDGAENAGVVAAVDGQQVTIALAVGGTLTALVDADTSVGCDDFGDAEDIPFEDDGDLGDDGDDLEDEFGDEELEDEEDGSTFGVKAYLAEEGDETAADDEEWEDDCVADLAPGTPVHEAEVEAGVFVVLELLLGDA